jgi:glycosyltransferase involved in cell wall biosynthesis
MLVSAIVPTYNRAHMIGRTIESILAQTYRDIEIIIVDDGSTDGTAEIISNYAENSLLPIKYYYKQNGGCASARNLGISRAHGGFFAFLDSDDSWMPSTIATLLQTLADTGADFVYSPSIEVMQDGEEIIGIPAAEGRPESFALEHFLSARARPCSIIYRRAVVEKIRFNETLRYNEDSDFLQRVAINFKAAYYPSPTSRVIRHSSNKSDNRIELYRSLYLSSAKILEESPEFKKSLGALATDRIDEIKTSLAEALINAQRYDEARNTVHGMGRSLRAPLRLSLFLGTKLPFEFDALFRRAFGRFKRCLHHSLKYLLKVDER